MLVRVTWRRLLCIRKRDKLTYETRPIIPLVGDQPKNAYRFGAQAIFLNTKELERSKISSMGKPKYVPTSVDSQQLAGGEGGLARGQEEDRLGHLVRFARPTQRVRRLAALEELNW